MKLMSLTLKNFKGVKSFKFEPNGNNADIYGDNGTGKTTVEDSVLWLLFGKDSANKKDFEIKTLTPEGEPIHNLEHVVEGTFDIDGQTLTLKKVYQEKWTKKRGSATSEFTGHTTDHFIDEVPVKAGEYNDKIAEICDEEAFKLLTSPTYFNAELHWENRRKVLLEVCGSVTQDDVIASNSALKELPEVLGDRTIEQHKKVIAQKKKRINDELKKIPVRIDEVEQNLPDVTGLKQKDLSATLAELEKRLGDKQAEISRIKNGGEVAEKTKQMRELESQLIEMNNKHRVAVDELVTEKREKLHKLTDNEARLRQTISQKKQAISSNENTLKNIEGLTESLRNQWYRVNALEFRHEDTCTCPTCGQDLPHDQVEMAREKALAEFNRKKAEQLEEINANGKREKEKADRLLAENKALLQEIDVAEKNLGKTRAEAEQLRNEIDSMMAVVGQPHETPEYKKLKAQIDKLNCELSDLQMGDRELLIMVQEEEATIKEEIQAVQDELRKFRDRKAGEGRIQELAGQEKKLAAEYEQLERELFLVEEYTKAEVALLEDKINSCFKHARFKLFKENINGGIEPCCETLYNGVPYNSNLNTGHRIIVGLDIINTLSEHYSFSPMVFIDNAEGVTQLPEVSAQIIRLIKPEIKTEADRKKYSKLVVKVHETKQKTLFEEAV